MTAKLLRISFEDGFGWVLSEKVAGGAGPAVLTLQDAEIAVDAADPGSLVRWTVFAADPSDPVPPTALDLIRRCFGPTAAEAIGGDPEPGSLTVEAGPVWQILGRAAMASFTETYRRPATPLTAVETTFATTTFEPALAQHRAWLALPAVGALGRAASSSSDLVDRLPDAARKALRERITTLRSVIEDVGELGSAAGPVNALVDLLTPVVGIPPELLAPTRERITFTGTARTAQIDPVWAPDDLRADLGRRARDVFAASATGEVPGLVRLRLRLRPDADLGFFAQVTVRVLTWDGEVLAAQLLDVFTPEGGLPVAECRLRASAPANDESLTRGVVLHLTVQGGPAPGAGQLRETARARAAIAGRRALLSERSGDVPAAAEAWRRCAGFLIAAGDRQGATAARNAAERSGGLKSGEGEWLADLERNWERLAERIVAEGTDDDLRDLVRDASQAFPALAAIAKAHTLLAERAGTDDDEAVAHWRAALDIWLERGEEGRASAAAAQLAERRRR